MSDRIHFAVLAHENEACVADLVAALWEASPGSTVSLFNGGRDAGFFAGQGVPICPNSTPLRYGNLTAFHIGVMRWLRSINADYEILVTLDHDMLPLTNDIAARLTALTAGAGYLGARFRPADNPDTWILDGATVSQINATWRDRWQPLFGTEIPHWSFNPGQVFTRDTVERILDFRGLGQLMDLASKSRIWAMEEIVYPTLAVAVGARPAALPGEHGLLFDYHSPADLVRLGGDPDVLLVHRITTSLAASDRRVAHAVRRGQEVDPAILHAPKTPSPPQPRALPAWHPTRVRKGLRWRYDHWHLNHRA